MCNIGYFWQKLFNPTCARWCTCGLRSLYSNHRHCFSSPRCHTLSLSLPLLTDLGKVESDKEPNNPLLYLQSLLKKKILLFPWKKARESLSLCCRTRTGSCGEWTHAPRAPARANHRSNRTNPIYLTCPPCRRAHRSASMTVKREMSFLTWWPLLVLPPSPFHRSSPLKPK